MGDTAASTPRAAAPTLRARFATPLAYAASAARAGEVTAGWLRAERSDFVRFNRGRVRQAGSVERAVLELRLIRAGAQAYHAVTLSGEAGEDRRRVDDGLARLRDAIAVARPDPHLSFSDTPVRSERILPARGPEVDALCDTVTAAAAGADLVGFYAGGPAACAMASSLGHDHWHETVHWNLDWSVYVGADKALKTGVAGDDWTPARVRDAIAASVRDAAILARPPKPIAPGRHRCLLGPRALADLVEMLGWGGFSARAHASGQSPLVRLRAGDAAFDPRVSIDEDAGGTGVPLFQADGFARPPSLPLVRAGRYGESLVSPRSAREFGLAANGASDAEAPEALCMAAGDLDEHDALARLGTGLSVSNLWYLNFSDRRNCRVTGMTRFATLWVEGGEPVAPVAPMRFDDSLYDVLGPRLLALTSAARRLPDTSTYEWRGFGASTVPGALVDGLAFTL